MRPVRVERKGREDYASFSLTMIHTRKIPCLQICGGAALKAEANRERGSILRLEAMILKRLAGKPHVTQLLQTGKKETYSYIVMTLLGESLDNLLRKVGKICTVSTQVRIGINILFGIKQIHDVGFIHRDLKPANIAFGYKDSPQCRFLHIFDFGLAREYIVNVDGKAKMRRPRPSVHFRGTIRYCSANVQERGEQGRMDDLWCLLYILAELRGPLPWARIQDRNRILRMKKDTELDELLENCPVEMIPFAEHISTLNYYIRPDYAFLYNLLDQVMSAGGIRFSDPYDWEKNTTVSRESAAPSTTLMQSEERKTASLNSSDMLLQSKKQVANLTVFVLFPLQQTPQSGILKLYKRSAFRDVPRKVI
ncbi:hypothetical protein Y032_0018g3500 [Ancylostoma ceylanicum]|uniref:Protein kinase domain-containing protein n=1 Tax=Ancylostoma ceylanicum TaxID=53326 RepID=A0A016V3Z9_9BILA|nr:hypothetical protein Y032_0018g3500 [Ancylostoma ceylanicum]